jgi:predicted phosphodiesterase
MIYGFLSDVHGNLQALEQVLNQLQVADRIICLGDIAGGRQVSECLARLRDFPCVLGNHDSWEFELQGLSEADCDFFKKLPLEYREADFLAVHSDYLVDPLRFPYIYSASEAARAFAHFPEGRVFFGHTHLQQLHWLTPEGELGFAKAGTQAIPLRADWRYLINVGEVSQGGLLYNIQEQWVQYLQL